LTFFTGGAAGSAILVVTHQFCAAQRAAGETVVAASLFSLLLGGAGGRARAGAAQEAITALAIVDAALAVVIGEANSARAAVICTAARNTFIGFRAVAPAWAMIVARQALDARAVVQTEATGAIRARIGRRRLVRFPRGFLVGLLDRAPPGDWVWHRSAAAIFRRVWLRGSRCSAAAAIRRLDRAG
jgi:hypothetical protein